MGQLLGLFRDPVPNGNEETSQVQFPPRSGCYFGSYFILGGEHFNTGRNDAYLFGDTNDLTFLSRRPAAFPYPAPAASEPSKTLQSLINVRRDSVKLVKVEGSDKEYNLQFILDSDASCHLTIYTLGREDVTSGVALFADAQSASQRYSYPPDLGQEFSQPGYKLIPAEFPSAMFKWAGSEPIPLIIHLEVTGNTAHSHSVFCVFEKSADNIYSIKVLKQKQIIDGISFMLQEIYGMESKGNSERSEGNGECVVCLSAPRDTMILPCRHLCLCYRCAEDMRFRSNCCLMCRQPFRALLRIEALQRVVDDTDEKSVSEYEQVDLVNFKGDYATTSLDSRSETRSVDLPGLSQTDIPLSVRTSVNVVSDNDVTSRDMSECVIVQHSAAGQSTSDVTSRDRPSTSGAAEDDRGATTEQVTDVVSELEEDEEASESDAFLRR